MKITGQLKATYIDDIEYGTVFMYPYENSVYYCMKVDMNEADVEWYNSIILDSGCLFGVDSHEPIYVVDATLVINGKEV